MDIYVNRDGQNLGPYSTEELRDMLNTGGIAGKLPAWREGMDEWSTVAGLLKDSSSIPMPDEAGGAPPIGADDGDLPLIAASKPVGRNRSTKLRPPGAASGPPPLPDAGEGIPSSLPEAPPPSSSIDDPALSTLRAPDHTAGEVTSSVPPVDSSPEKRGKAARPLEIPLSWLKLVGVVCVVGIAFSMFLPWIKAGPGDDPQRAHLGELFLISDQVDGQFNIDTPKFLRFLLLISMGGLLLSGLFLSLMSIRLAIRPIYMLSMNALAIVFFAFSLLGFLYFFYDIRIESLAAESSEAKEKFVPVVMDAGFYAALAILVAMLGIFSLPDSSRFVELPSNLVMPLLFFAGAAFAFFLADNKRKEAGIEYADLPVKAKDFMEEVQGKFGGTSEKEKDEEE